MRLRIEKAQPSSLDKLAFNFSIKKTKTVFKTSSNFLSICGIETAIFYLKPLRNGKRIEVKRSFSKISRFGIFGQILLITTYGIQKIETLLIKNQILVGQVPLAWRKDVFAFGFYEINCRWTGKKHA